jgi:hypothetical protein
MSRERGAGSPHTRSFGHASAAILVLLLITASLLGAPASASSTSPLYEHLDWSGAWSNGLVLCEFQLGQPTVSVSALSLDDTGLNATLAGVQEWGPSGLVAGWYGSAANWSEANVSNSSALTLEYSAQLPEGVPGATELGDVTANVVYSLPASPSSGAGAGNLVSMTVRLSNLTVPAPADSLRLMLALSPAYVQNEHLEGQPDGGRVTSVWDLNSTPLEVFDAGSSARLTNSSGSSEVGAVPGSMVSEESASVNVSVGSAPGEYRSISYVSQVGIVLPTTVLGVPTYIYVGVVGIAGLICVVVAVGSRSVRRRRSPLMSPDEDG